MLNSGKKFALHATKKKILNETKNHNPPCKLNGRSLRSSMPEEVDISFLRTTKNVM